MKKVSYILFFLLSFMSLNAQKLITNYELKAHEKGVKFKDVVAEVRAQLRDIETGMANGSIKMGAEQFRELEGRFERWVHRNYDRLLSDGSLAPGSYGWMNYLKEFPKTITTQAALHSLPGGTWTNMSPYSGHLANDTTFANGWTYGYGVGRVNVVRKVTGSNTLFAGTAAGGVFKSTNMGESWTPTTDQFGGLGVSDIVIHPTNSDTMYLATGDYDGSHMNSIGVFRSTNGGSTWAVTGLTFDLSEENRIGHIVINPDTPYILYASTQFRIKKSVNSGGNWIDLPSPGNGSSPGYFYNDIIYVPRTPTPRIYVTARQAPILYYSDNGGASWDSISVGKSEFNTRLDLAWSPNKPDSLFLFAEDNPAFRVLRISTNTFTAAWSTVSTPAATANASYYAFNTQQGYNQTIVVNPTNGDDIILGEFNGKRSTDGGATWTDYGNGYYDPASSTDNWGGYYLHSDHHFMEYIPGTTTLIDGNDGGVYIGDVNGQLQQKFNGLVATQSYSLAIRQGSPGIALLGNQDNDGFSRDSSNGSFKWFMAQAGDGTATAIDQTNSRIRLLGGTKGTLRRTDNGFSTAFLGTNITPAAGDGASFVFPVESHPQGIYHYGGYDKLMKYNTSDGSWAVLFDPPGKVDYIELANNNATTSKIYLINNSANPSSGGDAFRSSNEATFAPINAPEAGLRFKSISCSKTNWDSVFCTVTDYTAGKKVYFSTNGGGTWSNISGTLPNIKMDKIVFKQGSDTLFLGTELGLYAGKLLSNGTITWEKYGNGLPNVRISDIEIDYISNRLYTSTFGRGLWFIDLGSPALSLEDLTFTSEKSKNSENKYKLNWHWKSQNVAKIELQRKGQRGDFTTVKMVDKSTNTPDSYDVDLVEDVEYYRIKGTYHSGKVDYSKIISLSGNGNGNGNGKVHIFPNPTVDNINVVSNSNIKHVIVRDIAGRQITYAAPNQPNYSVDLGFLPQGIYVVEVLNDFNVITIEKVVIQRN
jgi:hypothetical protein